MISTLGFSFCLILEIVSVSSFKPTRANSSGSMGDDDLIRRSKGVDGERAKGRAGVHQNVVIICPEGCQQFGKALVLSFNQ